MTAHGALQISASSGQVGDLLERIPDIAICSAMHHWRNAIEASANEGATGEHRRAADADLQGNFGLAPSEMPVSQPKRRQSMEQDRPSDRFSSGWNYPVALGFGGVEWG